jgi:hypothetical protein
MDIPEWAFWSIMAFWGCFAVAMIFFVAWMQFSQPLQRWVLKDDKREKPPP